MCVCLLGLHLQYMEFPRLGVQSELQLLTQTTATATPDLSLVWDLHQSSRQHQILNPLREARNWTCLLMDTSQIHFHWATIQNSYKLFLDLTMFYLRKLGSIFCCIQLRTLTNTWWFEVDKDLEKLHLGRRNVLICSIDIDPSLSYFSLAILSNSGYEVEIVAVWMNPDVSWFFQLI